MPRLTFTFAPRRAAPHGDSRRRRITYRIRTSLGQKRQEPLETAAATIHGILPRAVAQYAHLGRSIAAVLMEHDAEVPEPTRTTKVGRNAPCPCGSGKKYKRCCGVTVH